MKNFIYIFLLVIIYTMPVFAQKTGVMFYQALDWSPDSKYLSFGALIDYDPKTDHYRTDIYVIKTDGTARQKISGDEKNPVYSSWSPDGRRIIFSVNDKTSQTSNILTVGKDGSNLTKLIQQPGEFTTPMFSPDGQKIAFMGRPQKSEKYQIYVMKTDGSGVTKLTDDPTASFCNPMWSPDGKKIVYYSDKGDQKDQVWVMNADGSNQTLLTGGVGHNIFPAFSPDGKRIIFSSSNRDGRNSESYVDGSYLYVMKPDGSDLKPLANIKSFFARFSPDGRKIAFIMGKFPESAVYTARADGSNIIRLTK